MAPMSTIAMAPRAMGPVKVEIAGPSSLLSVAVDTLVAEADPLVLILATEGSAVELSELVVPTAATASPASEPLIEALVARARLVVLSRPCALTEASSRAQSTSKRVLLRL